MICILAFLTVFGACAAEGVSVDGVSGLVRPGSEAEIRFTVPADGTADLALSQDAEGTRILSLIALGVEVQEGANVLYWNGTDQGVAAPEGEGFVVVRFGNMQASGPVSIGPAVPMLLNVRAGGEGEAAVLAFYATCSGEVSVKIGDAAEQTWIVEAGEGQITLELDGASGSVEGTAVLKDSLGMVSETVSFSVESGEVPEQGSTGQENVIFPDTEVLLDEEVEGESGSTGESGTEESAASAQDDGVFTPSTTSPYAPMENEVNYWTTPMDITDEAAVWAMITEPITVLDNGKKNNQKTQVVIRSAPDENSDGVGVVTMVSQGVRILERGDEWTKIECYSSSFHDSKVKAWNMLVQGYVPTGYLKTVVPDQEIGYVVDKLTQRIYIFQNGHLMDSLLVSTGHANEKQPYNETRSGEFLLLVPAVGGYEDDGMYVQMAIRYNGGDMMHQVPYTLARDGTKYFGTFEPRLGTKASHGCIRVQRRKTPDGYNIEWIWKHKKNNQKFLIWEDWQGRQLSCPDADTALYYNPKGGKYYHSSATCNSAKGVTFSQFTYGELESEGFASLSRCTWCNPPLRRAEIDEINALYAPGGDHDPILTQARIKSAESGK